MSDARPHDEASEVEALTDRREVQEGASPDAQRDAAEPVVEGDGVDADREVDLGSGAPDETDAEETGSDPGTEATDATGQDVDDAGTGTADTTDDPELDSPD